MLSNYYRSEAQNKRYKRKKMLSEIEQVKSLGIPFTKESWEQHGIKFNEEQMKYYGIEFEE